MDGDALVPMVDARRDTGERLASSHALEGPNKTNFEFLRQIHQSLGAGSRG